MATTSPDSVTPSMGGHASSVLARFKAAPAVTSEQYDETLRRLEALGNWPPEGLAYHVAFRSEGNFRVSEIWDSREQFDAKVLQHRHEALTERVELLARVPDLADSEVPLRTESDVVGESLPRPVAQRLEAAEGLVVLLTGHRGRGLEASKDARSTSRRQILCR